MNAIIYAPAIVAGIFAYRWIGLAAAFVICGAVSFVSGKLLVWYMRIAARARFRINKQKMRGVQVLDTRDNIFGGLRERALHVSAASLGLDVDSQVPFGVIMETFTDRGVATLACYSTGDASLYFSTGGGIIGGRGNERVRAAARKFVNISDPYSGLMAMSEDCPLPPPLSTVFYVLTTAGIRTADYPGPYVDDANGVDYGPLYFAGQEVIARIRELDEKASE